MIGDFDISPPPIDDDLSRMVESHRAQTGQTYNAILFFGLWGTADCSAEVRLYAGYRHLADNPGEGPAWLETARAHLEAGEAEKTLAILDELKRLGCPGLYPNLYSEDPDVHRVYALAESGRLAAALEELDALRGRHGESPVYHYLAGTILHGKSDFAAAAAAYDEAAEALAEFRREVDAEDMAEEIAIDFPACEAFIKLAGEQARAGRAFDGGRPLDLSEFLVAEDILAGEDFPGGEEE